MTDDLTEVYDRWKQTGCDPDQATTLYHACQRTAMRLRSHYTPENHVNGDKFEERFEDVFLHFTAPEVARRTPSDEFRGRFLRMLQCRMIDECRKQGRHPTVSLEAAEIHPTTEADVRHLMASEAKEEILRRAATLSPRAKKVLADRMDGLSYDEISAKERMARGSVSSALHDAHHQMMPLYQDIIDYNGGVLAEVNITGDDVRGAKAEGKDRV